jgi:hypothetical protein
MPDSRPCVSRFSPLSISIEVPQPSSAGNENAPDDDSTKFAGWVIDLALPWGSDCPNKNGDEKRYPE